MMLLWLVVLVYPNYKNTIISSYLSFVILWVFQFGLAADIYAYMHILLPYLSFIRSVASNWMILVRMVVYIFWNIFAPPLTMPSHPPLYYYIDIAHFSWTDCIYFSIEPWPRPYLLTYLLFAPPCKETSFHFGIIKTLHPTQFFLNRKCIEHRKIT